VTIFAFFAQKQPFTNMLTFFERSKMVTFWVLV